MSDLLDRLQDMVDFKHDDMDVAREAIEEITRLRAALAAARLVPPLNPDRWRGAINDALTNWMDSIFDDETPKDALRRLIKYEVDAALDSAVSQHAAELDTARLDGMKEAASLCDELPDHQGGICAIAIRMMIDEEDKKAAICAAAKEGKP